MAKKNLPSQKQEAGGGSLMGFFDRWSDGKKDFFCLLAMLVVVYAVFWGVIVDKQPFGLSGDTVSAFQWKNTLEHIRDTEGVEPLWVPYIYGGMPVFGSLLFPREVNYVEEYVLKLVVGNILFVFSEAHYILLHVFLAGVFMYLLVRVLKFPHLAALLAGLIFMLHPHAISLWEAFHWSKLATWSFIPLIFLLTYQLFQERKLLTVGLLAAAIGTMFLNRHPQLAFYGMLVVAGYFVYECVLSVRKEPARVAKLGLLFGVAVLIGVAIYSYELLPTREYADYSVRGGGAEGSSGGANYDWATNWSLHPLEMINYVVPSFFGFSSQVVSEWQGQKVPLPLYWGWMPFTDTPEYAGIIPVFLSLIALAYRRNRMTWFLAVFSSLVFLISFGNFFPIVYDLFFNYFPYFNKFRAPSMILFLIPFTLGLMGMYGLAHIIESGQGQLGEGSRPLTAPGVKKWLTGIGIVLALSVLGRGVLKDFMMGFMFNKAGEVQQYGKPIVDKLRELRFDILWKDLVTILVFLLAAVSLCYLYLRRKITASVLTAGLILITLADLLPIDAKFINPRPQESIDASLQPDDTMVFLKSDTTVFRVLALEQNLYKDNTLMNSQIQSVTGYSPAKLRIYQEMIDSALNHPTTAGLPVNMNVVNMMNTKYIVANGIVPGDQFTQVHADPAKKLYTFRNSSALERAWFADAVVVADSKAAMYAGMNSPGWNPAETAILLEAPAKSVSKPDSSSVALTTYESRRISIDAYTSADALLVLSEVYYPAGWTASVDGVETTIYRTDAVLRSVVVPAGRHTVEFVFDPPTYRMGSAITTGGWAAVVLLLVAGAWRNESVRKLIGGGRK